MCAINIIVVKVIRHSSYVIVASAAVLICNNRILYVLLLLPYSVLYSYCTLMT